MSDTSSLARELGAIASGEAWMAHVARPADAEHKRQTDRFATGLERLIDERIAAAVAPLAEKIAMLVTCEADGSAALARGDALLCCMGNGCGVVPHRRQPSPEAGPAWRCSGCGEPRSGPTAAEPALSRAGEHNPPSDGVKVGDAFRRVSGRDKGKVFEVTEVGDHYDVPSAFLCGYGWQDLGVLFYAEKWERVRAVDVPKAAEPVEVGDRFVWLTPGVYRGLVGVVTKAGGDRNMWLETGNFCRWIASAQLNDPEQFERMPRSASEKPPRKTYWICAGDNGCVGSGVLGGPRSCPNCHKPCIECYGNGQPVEQSEPVPGVVAVGDTFLRLTAVADTWDGGEVVTVESRPHYKSTGQPATMLLCDGHEVAIGQEDSLISGDWQRVPAGYVLPAAVEWHAATVRLIEARRLMKADPRTGTDGIDACIDAMARMAGMVPA
jgi:hypothetical protein